MADEFPDPFRYGLNTFPLEPPDEFGDSFNPTRYADPAPGKLQVVQAQLGFPRLRWQSPPAGPGLPGQATPPARLPEIPEWIATLMAALPKSGYRRRKANVDICHEIYDKDMAECHRRKQEGEYAHPDFYGACLDNASRRLADCISNRGRPSKIPVWSLAHEEVYRNHDR